MLNKKIVLTLLGIGIILIGSFIMYVKFIKRDSLTNTHNTHHPNSQSLNINRSISGLKEAESQKTISLSSGQTYDLEASFVKKEIAGRTIRMLAYNNQIPGPRLEVTEGDTITISLKNKLDEDTTIHWHGVRVENKFDGVPDSTQPAVKPGELFTYTVHTPDPGLYWYHPHTREDYEQELGLYGLLFVKPKDENYFNKVNREEFLILDDLLLEQKDVIPFESTLANHTLMGRFGNTMFINGKSTYSLQVKKNEIVRFAVVNTANTRPFKMAISGVKMKLVGGDSGVYDQETFVDNVILSPSERILVEILFDKPGTYQLLNKTPQETTVLGSISVDQESIDVDYSKSFTTLRTKQLSQAVALLNEYKNKPVDKTINLTMNMPGMMNHMNHGAMMHRENNPEGIEWEDTMAMMNEQSTSKNLTWIMQDATTKKENMDVMYSFKQGEKVKIRLFNDPKSMHPMQHPMHFHGNRFLILSVNGVPNTNPVWKDTVLVPTGATIDILLDASNKGTWMAHCHIAEHLQSNMMISYNVE